MTICKVTGMACTCQPDEGVQCDGEQTLREGFHGWRNAALRAERDAARYRYLRELPAVQAQAFFWNFTSRKQRDAVIDGRIAAQAASVELPGASGSDEPEAGGSSGQAGG